MAIRVTDTKAGRSISAYIILNKRDQHVATVQAHFADSGNVSVNVFDMTGKRDTQYGSASGGGYDKFTAALAGLVIDGHTMADHCGTVPEVAEERARIMKSYVRQVKEVLAVSVDPDDADTRAALRCVLDRHNKRVVRIGARFANYMREEYRYSSLYFEAGLDRLQALGYRVIQAI